MRLRLIWLVFDSDKFGEWITSSEMIKCGTDYRTVAVIGCQSSGKSTLLNLLFDTTFIVMDEQLGRQQTTKGIWMNRNKEGNIMVLDIEGTDSKERGEQRLVSWSQFAFELTFNFMFFIRRLSSKLRHFLHLQWQMCY